MKRNDAEKILAEAVAAATPDVFDSVLSRCELKGGKIVNMDEIKNKKENNNKGMAKRLVAVAAALALVAGCGLGFGSFQKAHAEQIVVSVDAGSDVTVGVNADDVVVSVSENTAGVEKSDVKGKDIKEAVGIIVEKMAASGDITSEDNIVLLSVENAADESDEVDEELTDAQKEIEEELTDAIEEVLDECGIDVSVIGQSFDKDKIVDEIADEFSISTGKVSFIQKILSADENDDEKDIGDLADMSISDIIEYAATWLSEAGITVDGDVTVNVGTDGTDTEGSSGVDVTVGTDADVSVTTDADGSFSTHVEADDGDVVVDVNTGADYSLDIEVDGEKFSYDSTDPTGSMIGIIESIIKAS